MRTEQIDLWDKDEYQYGAAFGFIPNIHGYIHDENEDMRTCLIVVPGGGYRTVSPTEGEIVAKKFYDMGYNTFVCTYTTNILLLEPLKMQPLKDLSRAVRYVRKYAEEFHISKVVVCGFSAGGHLAGSLCVHWQDVDDEKQEMNHISSRPDAAILSYPVITSGEFAHLDSFKALLGEPMGLEDREYMSLEKQVTDHTPPIFLWQTITDELVPVENSILMVQALKEKGKRWQTVPGNRQTHCHRWKK